MAPRNSASLPLDKKVLMLNDFLINDCSLLLYSQGVDVWRSFGSFIENGLANGEICLYAYDESNNKLQLDTIYSEAIASGKLRKFPLGKGYLPKEIEKLNDELKNLCADVRSDKCPAIILADFGGLVTRHSFEKAVDFIKAIISKKEETFNSRQEKKKQPLLRTAIMAFNLESLDEEHIKVLIGLNRRGQLEPGIELAPKDSLEHFVKRHLETIVLSMLSEHPMCGYDVIKTIYQRYYSSLSQGTVYSLLYSLESKGLLSVMKSDSQRSKLYVLTEQGRTLADSKIKDFVVAQRYLLESIQKT